LVTPREGSINVHPLVWNQFDSTAYTDMLRYAWRHTDPAYSIEELSARPVPPMVQELKFNFDASRPCEVHDCTNHVFSRCAHCGKHLCLRHFLQRVCFNEEDDGPRPGTSSDTPIVGRFVPRPPVPEYDGKETSAPELPT